MNNPPSFATANPMLQQSRLAIAIFLAVMSCVPLRRVCAEVFTFGNGTNAFEMEFVEIGSPGNRPLFPSPNGQVDYEYAIGKYEVSEQMIHKYNASFGNANSRWTTARPTNRPPVSHGTRPRGL